MQLQQAMSKPYEKMDLEERVYYDKRSSLMFQLNQIIKRVKVSEFTLMQMQDIQDLIQPYKEFQQLKQNM